MVLKKENLFTIFYRVNVYICISILFAYSIFGSLALSFDEAVSVFPEVEEVGEKQQLITIPSVPEQYTQSSPVQGKIPVDDFMEGGVVEDAVVIDNEDNKVDVEQPIGDAGEVFLTSNTPHISSGEEVVDLAEYTETGTGELTGYVYEDTKEVLEEIVITHPDCQPRFDEQGRLFIDTCLLLQITGSNIYDSSAFLAREQLISLLVVGGWDDMSLIPDGDLQSLLVQGKEQGYLNHVDQQYLLQSLQTVSKLTEKTVFDTYVTWEENMREQAHRLVIVLGNDGLLYVLDPTIGTSSSHPQLLESYIAEYTHKSAVARYVQTEGYNPLLAEREVDLEIDTQIVLDTIRVDIPAQTLAVEDIGGDSDFWAREDIIVEQESPHEFIIGDGKSHLAFSEPIRIEINTDLPQGTTIPLFVKHEGDEERGTRGLTTTPNATCTDGISSHESSVGMVMEGKVVFWSCGASTFMVDLTLDIGGGLNGTVSTVALQGDGKYLAGGSFTGYDNILYNRLIRFTTTGSVDSGFILGTGFNNIVNVIAVQSDGKILVGGTFTNYAGTARNRLIRLTTTGALDTSFIIGAGFNNTVNAIAVQSDGKILVGGAFTSYAGTTQNRITRLTTTGARDTSFVIGAGASSTVSAIAVQSDGKIVIGGAFTSYAGTAQNRITRLTTTGARDTSFGIGTAFNSTVSALALQSDGKIIVGGGFTTYSGAVYNRVVRLTTTGAADTSFVLGAGASSTVSAIAVQSDGKVVFGGAFTSYSGTTQNRLTRVTTTGARDTTFAIGGGANNTVNAVAIQSDGKIILGGTFTTYNSLIESRIVRINSTGTKDATIPIIGFDNFINAVVLQPDGKLIVGGLFSHYSGTAQNRIARLTTTGALDPTFVIGVGFNNAVNALALQADGKIVVGGTFTSYAGTAQNRITRLTTTGARDTSFVIGAGASSTVSAIALQADGKIVIGGAFTSYAGTAQSRITRLTTTGARDTSFVIGAGASSTVSAIAVQPDGNILIGGAFTSYAGTAQNRITRLTTTGARDTSFVIGAGASSTVSAIAVQPDGNILIGGAFTSYAGTAQNRITRLTTTGARDTTFNIGAGLNSTVSTIAVQTDGKILVGGAFTTYSGTTQNRITRLLNSGVRDMTLAIGGGFDNTVTSVVSESPSKIIAGGSFLSFNMQAAYALARLFSIPDPVILTPTSGQVITSPNVTLIGTGEPLGVVTINVSGSIRTGAISSTGSWSVAYTGLSTGIKIASGYVDANGNRSDTTIRTFSVTQGDVCIVGPVVAMTGIQATSSSQLIELQTDYFRVQDELGDFTGYYTTVSLSTLSGSVGGSIPTSLIEWKADPVQLLSGSTNAFVVLGTGMSTYSYATAPIVFIKRDPGALGSGIFGTYGAKLRLRVTIPAYQAVTTYSGTLTYTLYDT